MGKTASGALSVGYRSSFTCMTGAARRRQNGRGICELAGMKHPPRPLTGGEWSFAALL